MPLEGVQDATVDEIPGRSADSVEALYRREGRRLWRALLLYSGDREVADDAVSEAFAQLLRRGNAVQAPDRWVWKAAFKLAAGELSARGAMGGSAPDRAAPELPQRDERVAAALLQLSLNQRSSIVLHYYAGYTYKEVARIIRSTPSAVSVHVTRGRRRLKTLLEEYDA
jgi:DNA-directed RNA polymerase specialized sigma24 family protein